MSIELIPAAFVTQELSQKIMVATNDIESEWFFYDGAFNNTANIQTNINTWQSENFVAVHNKEILYYEDFLL